MDVIRATVSSVLLSVLAIFGAAAIAHADSWPPVVLSSIGTFDHPVHITGAGDGSARVFVVELTGKIKIVEGGTTLATPFIDLTSRLDCGDGRKRLLSLAFPPGYGAGGHFYVKYLDHACNIVVSRFLVTANPDIADPTSEQIVLTQPVGQGLFGGPLYFGPDGYLYVTFGDGSLHDSDVWNTAQDPTTLLGKMLRLDVETGHPATYTIPTTNPFVNAATFPGYKKEIWALGFRNPWRFSFDHQTGDLYVADIGANAREEIDVQSTFSLGGENYGWKIMEGDQAFLGPTNTPGLTAPTWVYDHTQGNCAVTGGSVYRGTSYPALQGIYVYADQCSGRISGLRKNAGSWESGVLNANTGLAIVTFGEDDARNLYAGDYNGGGVYRLVASAAAPVSGTAALIQTDTTTQGTWIGKYGAAGYTIPSGATNASSGAQVSVTGASYIWSAVTTDVRALQQPSSVARLASTWYLSSNFTIDTAFSDTLPHLVTLYAMDWDRLGRTETIDVLDAATGTILNTQNLSGFAGGTYLTWQVTGHVSFRVTNTNPSANAVVGGLFFDAPGSSHTNVPPTVTMNAPTGPFTAPATVPLTATALDSDGTVTQVQFFANGTTLLGTGVGTNPATLSWAGVTAGTYSVTAVATDDSLATTTSNAVSVIVSPPSGGGGNAALFVKTDPTTQGSWRQSTLYGKQAYVIANTTPSLPATAVVTPAGQSVWTWAGFTSDVRALQAPTGTNRAATTYYASSAFTVDVTLTDGAPHQLALYLVDWDFAARSTKVEVLDGANTASVLDTRVVNSFSQGVYVIWQVSGHVQLRLTNLAGPNAVLSGLFLDPPASGAPANVPPTVTMNTPTGPFTGPATVPLTATALDSDGTVTQVQFFNGTTLLGTATGTNPATFNWTGVAAGTYSLTAVATDSGSATTTSNAVSVTVLPGASSGTTVTYVKTDTTTQGTWKTVYGTDAATVVNASTAFPSYAAVTVSGNSAWTWNGSTSEVQALQKPGAATDRIAAVWYSPTSFTIDVNITDGQGHQIALYGLDYPLEGRSQRIDVLNATTQAVLDTRTVSGFAGGQYWVYQVSGHVTFVLTRLAGPNAGVSGIFFGAAGGVVPNVAPTVTLNSPTGGPWTAPATVGLSANASDTDGTISSVKFYDGATLIGTSADAAAPYTFSWTNVGAGSHTVTAQATDNAGATTTSAPVTVTVALPSGSGPSATYVKTDSTTQGTWRTVYGADGYALAQVGTVQPSYGTISATSLMWTWASPTSVVQALQQPSGTSRIAATWYGATNIDLAVNLTDGNVHQVALYGLDFDASSRSQRIDVLNASTHAVLDTRTMSGFSAGQYWVYQVSGSVIFRVTRLTGPNAAIAAVFVDSLNGGNVEPTVSASSPAGGPFMAPATVVLSATASDSDGTIAAVNFYNGATLIGTSPSTGNPYTFAWTNVAAGNYSITAQATDNGGATVTSAPVNVTVEPTGGFAATFASFVQSDITTEGTWIGNYGRNGYTLANMTSGSANPSYATVTPVNQFSWTWTYSTTFLHALQQPPDGTNRVAAAWYSPSTFDVAVNLTDGLIHKVSIYCVDWSSLGRLQRIDVLDASTNAVLDSQTLSNFNTGIYLTWQMRGNVIFRITHILGGARGNVNAVFNGIFFDTP
jgi:glucose/arabinose dehydrogenase/uncharacterized protein (DUF2141 family)